MSIDDLKTVERLNRIVGRLTSHPDLREELMQEALIHLWQVQEQQPGQSESWYLQSCRYHLQHFLVAGRSVDSPKRRAANVNASLNGEDDSNGFLIEETVECGVPILADISARDLIEATSQRLAARERAVLRCLAEEWKTCEIAQHLKISHPTVVKSRRKIARMLNQLTGVSRVPIPLPNGRQKPIATERNGESVLLLAD
jgi:DNA-directed RNA polymerase specialized sigma24 family protein